MLVENKCPVGPHLLGSKLARGLTATAPVPYQGEPDSHCPTALHFSFKKDRLHNLWGPVHNENVGSLVQKCGEFQDDDSRAFHQETGRLSKWGARVTEQLQAPGARCDFKLQKIAWEPPPPTTNTQK